MAKKVKQEKANTFSQYCKSTFIGLYQIHKQLMSWNQTTACLFPISVVVSSYYPLSWVVPDLQMLAYKQIKKYP